MNDPWRFQRWAFEQTTGSPTRKAVLSMLAMMADAETGRCEAKAATLAMGVECHERVVRGHLKTLEESGLIVRRPQFRRDRGRRGDEFLILAPGVVEWPDGEPVVHPAKSAGGSDDAQHPIPPATDSHPPRLLVAGQEQPLKNGRSANSEQAFDIHREEWPGVPQEMYGDAQQLLRAKTKVGTKLVTTREMLIAAAALAEFNRQMESSFGLGANLRSVVMRIRERPSWDHEKHVRLVQSACRRRWWEKRNSSGRRATPNVIYGGAFENVIQDAADEAAGKQIPDDFSLKDKVWPDGRTWDELGEGERYHAIDAAKRGIKPWLAPGTPGGPDALPDTPALAVAHSNGNGNGNGHKPGWTAENFLQDDPS